MTKILIVDDETQSRQRIKEYLKRILKDSQIYEAEKGEEALEKIDTEEFDLIILDIKLPGVSGIDILKKTQAKNLNYLVISGWDSFSVAKEALNLGAKDYLPKPFSMKILGLKVRELLSQR